MHNEAFQTAETLITVVPEANILTIAGLETEDITLQWPRAHEIKAVGRDLAAIAILAEGSTDVLSCTDEMLAQAYIKLTKRHFVSGHFADHDEMRRVILKEAVDRLSNIFPPAIIRYDHRESTFRVGAYAVASRKPNEQELSDILERQEAIKAELQRNAEQEEALKINLHDYDHAIVTVGDVQYYLQLDVPEALFAARVLEAIQQGAKNNRQILQLGVVARIAWANMPLVERALHYQSNAKYNKAAGENIRKKVEALTDDILFAMHISDFGTTNGIGPFKNIPNVAFYKEPTESHNDATPIFPPGTNSAFVIPGSIAEIRSKINTHKTAPNAQDLTPYGVPTTKWCIGWRR